MALGRLRIVWVVGTIFFLGSCSGATRPEVTGGATTTQTTATSGSSECPRDADATPWDDGASTDAVVVQNGSASVPVVALAKYPLPDYQAKLWSSWSQGLVSADGRFFSSLGDHNGANGDSFVFEYDPAAMTLTQVVDVLAVVPHEDGDWGYGKIHAQMVNGLCGAIFLSTYWGSRRGLTFTDGYQGDVLLRLDPAHRTVSNLGVILAEHGVASLAASPDGSLIYAEAADPIGEKTGSFVVLDAENGDPVFSSDDSAHGGYRNIAVGSDGLAYITWNDTSLAVYDPEANSLAATSIQIPGGILRASTQPDPSGRIFAVTRDPAVFFVLDPDGTVTELGPALGYTTSMALSPGGDRFYYIPDAHGGAWRQGAPLIAVDTTTGDSEVVVELNPLVEQQFGLRAGGTYSVAVDGDGKTIFVVLNAGDPDNSDAFGEVILAVVTLP